MNPAGNRRMVTQYVAVHFKATHKRETRGRVTKKQNVALDTLIAGRCTDEPNPFVIFTGQNSRDNAQHFFYTSAIY
jgi:peptide subunit release factor 1 (eRF1)